MQLAPTRRTIKDGASVSYASYSSTLAGDSPVSKLKVKQAVLTPLDRLFTLLPASFRYQTADQPGPVLRKNRGQDEQTEQYRAKSRDEVSASRRRSRGSSWPSRYRNYDWYRSLTRDLG